MAPAWPWSSRLTSRVPREVPFAEISPLLGSQPSEAAPEEVLASSASRGLAPREGLELLLVKPGRTGPLVEPRRGPQAGKSGYPRYQNTDKVAFLKTPGMNPTTVIATQGLLVACGMRSNPETVLLE